MNENEERNQTFLGGICFSFSEFMNILFVFCCVFFGFVFLQVCCSWFQSDLLVGLNHSTDLIFFSESFFDEKEQKVSHNLHFKKRKKRKRRKRKKKQHNKFFVFVTLGRLFV